MLKAGSTSMLPALKKLFNTILSSGIYPTAWSESWVTPIHKGGDHMDPNRYRGISVMSCMGKLFCSILNNRLANFIQKYELGNKYQVGFTKNCRTSDHMLTLKTLVDKYSQNNRKLYTCFIDFSKAFDTVWREGLFYKLLKMGIGGNFVKTIRNMYNRATTQIRLKDGLTEHIGNNIGVKQGCVLSPTLFKLFINDMHKLFDKQCDPAKLHNEDVSCLMFADDVVLVSETAEGMQKSLDKLDAYCKNWLLKVNYEKTKIMIFNKAGKRIKENFTLDNTPLECTDSYTYLGLVFVPSGTFTAAIETLCKKASKAMFKLRHSIHQLNTSPKLSLYLYDTLVRPIYMYGSEVWGPFMNTTERAFDITGDRYNLFDKNSFEKLDLKFCRGILGVHKKASNAAVRGELGRYPAIIQIIRHTLKNWIRITTDINKDTILYDTYLSNIEMKRNTEKCWWSKLSWLIESTLGLAHLLENQGARTGNKNKIDRATSNMKKIFEFQWHNELNKHNTTQNRKNKLKTYHLFKKDFKYEKYLDLQSRFGNRRLITKFRISAHRLEIETGRYNSRKSNKSRVDENERICKLCNLNEVENEIHVLLKCPKYDPERKSMVDRMETIYPIFAALDPEGKFQFLMGCCDWEATDILKTMLVKIRRTRGIL
jgi:hypothetical protein